uniref:RNA-directed DNA polymerase from mobile element jockey-like n=1 Tax=Pectinophora gossypiella TaxID=13191 RepID=A0A1E1VZH4_PECGO
MVSSLRDKTYEERLSLLNLTTLEQRRKRGDLIETYKILHDHYDVQQLKDIFKLSKNVNLRGHSLKLYKPLCASNPKHNFLPNRVVDSWNKLPESIVSAPSVNSFKHRLDIYNRK